MYPIPEILVGPIMRQKIQQFVQLKLRAAYPGTGKAGVVSVKLLLHMNGNHQDGFFVIERFAHRLKSRCGGIGHTAGHAFQEEIIIDTIQQQVIVYHRHFISIFLVPEEPERDMRIFCVPVKYLLVISGIDHISVDI